MAALSISLLKLVQQAGASSSESKQKANDGFNALLDISQRSPEAIREKQQDPVAGLAIQPVFFAPDTTTTIKSSQLSAYDTVRDVAAEPEIAETSRKKSLPDNQPEAPVNGKKLTASNDQTRPTDEPKIDVEASDSSQDVTPEDSSEPTTNTTSNASASQPTQPADVANPNEDSEQSVQQLVAQFNQQIEVMISSGKITNPADFLSAFLAQLKATLAAVVKTAQITGSPVVAVSVPSASDLTATTMTVKSTTSLTAMMLQTTNVQAAEVGVAGGAPTQASMSAQMMNEFSKQLEALLAQYGAGSQDTASTNEPLKAALSELMGKLSKLTEMFSPVSDSLSQTVPDWMKSKIAAAPVMTASSVAEAKEITKSVELVSLPSVLQSVVAGEPVKQNALIAANNNANVVSAMSQPIAVAAGSSSGSLADQNGQGGGESRQQSSSVPLPVSSTAAASSDTSAKIHGASFSRLLNHESSRPVLDQVTFQIKTALKDGSSQITIQLDPVELGKLDIKLQVASDGRTQVVVTADNKDTLAMLQKDSAGLERALSDAGLKADSGSLSFNLRQGQQERDPEYAQASGTYNKTMPEEDEIPPASVIARSYMVSLAEGLDIKI